MIEDSGRYFRVSKQNKSFRENENERNEDAYLTKCFQIYERWIYDRWISHDAARGGVRNRN
jgi:hypothetical protein